MKTAICAWIIREKHYVQIKAEFPVIITEESDYSTHIIHNAAAGAHTIARS